MHLTATEKTLRISRFEQKFIAKLIHAFLNHHSLPLVTKGKLWYLKKITSIAISTDNKIVIYGAGDFNPYNEALETVVVKLRWRKLLRRGTITFIS
jgi:hypothetical protein